jgi:hypothetical protein
MQILSSYNPTKDRLQSRYDAEARAAAAPLANVPKRRNS